MIDARKLSSIINASPCDAIIVEKSQPMPKQGVSSVFRYGETYGVIQACCLLRDVPLRIITPSKWKKHFGLKGKEKEHALATVRLKWPQFDHLFARKKDHNRAEAALIGLYHAETHIG